METKLEDQTPGPGAAPVLIVYAVIVMIIAVVVWWVV